MATLPQPPVQHVSSLKATTRVMLQGKVLRQRATVPGQIKVSLTPYSPSVHGLGFLLHVWNAAVQHREQIQLFGPSAETLETFVAVYRNVEMVVVHQTDAEDWMHGHGLLAVAYFDDVDGTARARIHHFLLPEYRTPHMSQGLATLVLQYAYEQRGWAMLYGLTPAQNHGGIRFALRLGFERERGLWQMTYDGQICDGVRTVLSRERWAARRMIEG